MGDFSSIETIVVSKKYPQMPLDAALGYGDWLR